MSCSNRVILDKCCCLLSQILCFETSLPELYEHCSCNTLIRWVDFLHNVNLLFVSLFSQSCNLLSHLIFNITWYCNLCLCLQKCDEGRNEQNDSQSGKYNYLIDFGLGFSTLAAGTWDLYQTSRIRGCHTWWKFEQTNENLWRWLLIIEKPMVNETELTSVSQITAITALTNTTAL